MTTARDVFQRSCYSALQRYKIDVDNHVWRPTADDTLVSAILKAWEASLFAEGRAAYGQRGVPAPAKRDRPPRTPQEAAARLRRVAQ